MGTRKRIIGMLLAIVMVFNCAIAMAEAEATAKPTKPTAEGYEEQFEGYYSVVHKAKDGKNKIFGKLYVPDGTDLTKPQPILVLSHGIGMTYEDFNLYIPHYMELGLVCYAFDFCGGGNSSKSGGDTTDMTVGTEVSNLKAVIEDLKTQAYCDVEKIVLSGQSFGGMVSGIVAADLQEQIAGEILIYPALVVVDDAHKEYATVEDIPATMNVRGMKCGKALYAESWDWNLSEMVAAYTGKVLILHGDSDSAVPYEYSVNVQPMFNDAKLVTVPGGDHGFTAEQIDNVFPEVVTYLTQIGIIQ